MNAFDMLNPRSFKYDLKVAQSSCPICNEELLNIRAAATCVRHETYLSLSDLAGTLSLP